MSIFIDFADTKRRIEFLGGEEQFHCFFEIAYFLAQDLDFVLALFVRGRIVPTTGGSNGAAASFGHRFGGNSLNEGLCRSFFVRQSFASRSPR